MIFISAQPDTTYFTWQLVLQLRNFHTLGILKENIHILVAYNKEMGLNPIFEKFIEENSLYGTFFLYEDQRERPTYISSIRPNILKQHFKKYPELSDSTLMYHDSDILFSRIPNMAGVEENEICYVSDTRNYLDVNYIRRASSEALLDDMLQIVGLDKAKLLQEDKQTGGAQYVLKGITPGFWEKVERNSEDLFRIMSDYNSRLWEREYPTKKVYRSKTNGIQAWCADMWALLWNLWLIDTKVEIHPEMAFSWPDSPIADWHGLAIQHYSGKIDDKTNYFRKIEYINYMPWYDESLNSIPNTNCSYEIVQIIKQEKAELDQKRVFHPDAEIILYVNAKENQNDRIIQIYKKYIQKYLDINVTVNSQIWDEKLAIQKSEKNGNAYLIIPADHLLSITDIKRILNVSARLSVSISTLYQSDVLFTEAFSKMLEIELLTNNRGKFIPSEYSKPIYWTGTALGLREKPIDPSLKLFTVTEAFSLS